MSSQVIDRIVEQNQKFWYLLGNWEQMPREEAIRLLDEIFPSSMHRKPAKPDAIQGSGAPAERNAP